MEGAEAAARAPSRRAFREFRGGGCGEEDPEAEEACDWPLLADAKRRRARRLCCSCAGRPGTTCFAGAWTRAPGAPGNLGLGCRRAARSTFHDFEGAPAVARRRERSEGGRLSIFSLRARTCPAKLYRRSPSGSHYPAGLRKIPGTTRESLYRAPCTRSDRPVGPRAREQRVGGRGRRWGRGSPRASSLTLRRVHVVVGEHVVLLGELGDRLLQLGGRRLLDGAKRADRRAADSWPWTSTRVQAADGAPDDQCSRCRRRAFVVAGCRRSGRTAPPTWPSSRRRSAPAGASCDRGGAGGGSHAPPGGTVRPAFFPYVCRVADPPPSAVWQEIAPSRRRLLTGAARAKQAPAGAPRKENGRGQKNARRAARRQRALGSRESRRCIFLDRALRLCRILNGSTRARTTETRIFRIVRRRHPVVRPPGPSAPPLFIASVGRCHSASFASKRVPRTTRPLRVLRGRPRRAAARAEGRVPVTPPTRRGRAARSR